MNHRSLTSVDDAVRLITERTPELPPEHMPLAQAFGRTLRESVGAPHDLPRTDRSTMDGYAVLADESVTLLRVVRTAATNDAGACDFGPGEAMRVSTGTALTGDHPLRVIPIEAVKTEDDYIRFETFPEKSFVHRRGSDAKAGDILLRPGETVSPGVVALLASLGRTEAVASPRLRIRHYTTGDEVVAAGQPLPPGSIHDSNGPLIAALLAALGEGVAQRHLGEDYAAALARVREDFAAGEPHLLLVSGGAGPGSGDFTEKLLRELGYDIALRGGVNVRPGKPVIFGTRPGGVAFGLPGNPLSQWASFHTFVLPAIRRLRGEAHRTVRIRAKLTEAIDGLADPRPTYHPAWLDFTSGEPRVTVLPWSASGNVFAMASSNAMVFVAPDVSGLRAGDTVEVELLPTQNPF